MFNQFQVYTPFQASLLNSQELAFVGDGIYSFYIRAMIVAKGNNKVNVLHKKASDYVKASSQSKMLEKTKEMISEEELAVIRRAKNYKTNNKAKNATIEDYKNATGFEALLGYLYLSNQTEKLEKLLNILTTGENECN